MASKSRPGLQEARNKEAQAFTEALAAIPQKYHEMHPTGFLHHRVLKMLKAWIADLNPADDTTVAESFSAEEVEGRSEDDQGTPKATTYAEPQGDWNQKPSDGTTAATSSSDAVVDDSDEDMTITDDEITAAEALEQGGTGREDDDNVGDDEDGVEEPLGSSSKRKRTNSKRRAETADFATTLQTMPLKYKNMPTSGLKQHRVIEKLREWIADLIAEQEEKAERKEEVELLLKVDRGSEIHRLRVANNLLLGEVLKRSKGLEGKDDATSQNAKTEIDRTVRKAWLCITSDSEQDKENKDGERGGELGGNQ